MDPKDVHVAVQAWVNSKPGVSLLSIRNAVYVMLSQRYLYDPLQKIIIDKTMNPEMISNKKEGLQMSMIVYTLHEFGIQWADCEIAVPKPKPGRSLATSVLEDSEKFSITKMFTEFYD